MNFDRLFIMTWKRFGLMVTIFILSVMLHNVISTLFGFEEALFFIIAIFVIPMYFIVSLIYTSIKKIGGKR